MEKYLSIVLTAKKKVLVDNWNTEVISTIQSTIRALYVGVMLWAFKQSGVWELYSDSVNTQLRSDFSGVWDRVLSVLIMIRGWGTRAETVLEDFLLNRCIYNHDTVS